MSPRGGYRTLLQCDVWRERDRFLAHHEGGEREEDEDGDETEAGTAVLGLHYWSSSSSLSLDQRFPKEIRSEIETWYNPYNPHTKESIHLVRCPHVATDCYFN